MPTTFGTKLLCNWEWKTKYRQRQRREREKWKKEELILWHVAMKYIKPKGNRIHVCNAHFVYVLTNYYEWFMSWLNKTSSFCTAKFVKNIRKLRKHFQWNSSSHKFISNGYISWKFSSISVLIAPHTLRVKRKYWIRIEKEISLWFPQNFPKKKEIAL